MRTAVLWSCLLLLTGCSRAQTGGPPLVDAYPGLRFTQPVDLQAPPDGSPRLFVVEQPGRIKVFATNAATPVATTFLDLTDRVASGGELGLLGLAFHPQFAQNRTFFVFYTRQGGSAPYQEVVARYRVSPTDPNVADPASGEVLLTVPDPFSNHNGGQLQFGPDGYLYVALGDGGSGGDPQGNGQNTNTLLGSILRLDVDDRAGSLAPECDASGAYRVPADNPFAGSAAGCGEIFAYGFRNPWRFSFVGDRIWVGDVGQGAWEEVNEVVRGGNYGWNVWEGRHCYNAASCNAAGMAFPLFEYGHNSSGGFSITGGYRQSVSDLAVGACPGLAGTYVYGDYVSRNIWSFPMPTGPPKSGGTLIVEGSGPDAVAVSTFGLDPNGRLLVADHSGGRVMAFNCAVVRGPVARESLPRAGPALELTAPGPNPFAGATTLWLTVERPRHVTVAAFDVLGREVARLFDGVADGTHALTLDGARLAPGLYRVQALAEGVATAVSVVRRR